MTETMLAGRLDVRAKTFAVEEVPVPEPGPGQVRIRVKAAGVCLSDVHLIDGSIRPLFLPADKVTLGHEVSGVVDALGPDVPPAWTAGQRVLLQAGERCGRCANCVSFAEPCLQVRTRGVDYDGGWAEYALATHHTLVAVPDDLPFEQAAVIPDAVSTPWAAIVSTGKAAPARPAGVWGVGGLGTHAVQLLRLVGAVPIIAIDPIEAARERASALGADAVLDSAAPDLRERIRELTAGRGLDLALDMAGAPAVREQAVSCLAPGGRLVLVGLTPDPLTITQSIPLSYFAQQILGHYGSTPEHVVELVELVRHGRLDLGGSISGTLPLTEAAAAVERLARKEGDPVRLILTP
ncbi:zinc-binding dehydrogenase [Planomonospora venezuelensis]|uniref:Threonine dehydrogenase-like Zn-dependent dehydrogenase n=1 Tax=Planomonospora venezuelensis TaxID=1999 RepID=A0A841CZQ9_PLAVE|nr:zinc-binding dehydrogenase [Planomonospora venezuelensis]MBB5963471.1 threonine dehydrogenase-like Zn-dependent dehydrogenase [Planomonospora venezuelensis]GIN02195.1 alcohol dehydrogenase [Planomonospora venezuelensis]